MIQDLLREIVGERWVECIDFDTGERVDTSYVSPKHENRESDVIRKFRRKDAAEPVYVYILPEFQSRPDLSMPVRLMDYRDRPQPGGTASLLHHAGRPSQASTARREFQLMRSWSTDSR